MIHDLKHYHFLQLNFLVTPNTNIVFHTIRTQRTEVFQSLRYRFFSCTNTNLFLNNNNNNYLFIYFKISQLGSCISKFSTEKITLEEMAALML